MGAMNQSAAEVEASKALRASGARFAFVHGSRAQGAARPRSDLDVAAWWGGDAPASWEVTLPAHVDLLVLDGAPLELAGRVALAGRLLFDDDPPARVAWQAQTRLIYLDEQSRQEELSRIFRKARLSGR
jgi:predicted nucleotidyltransferase